MSKKSTYEELEQRVQVLENELLYHKRMLKDSQKKEVDLEDFFNMENYNTSMVEAQNKLHESESRFRALVEHAADGLYLASEDGKIIEVNKAAERQTGFCREELLEMSVEDLDPRSIKKDDRDTIWSKLKPGETFVLNTTHTRKDGSSFPVEINISIIELVGQRHILGSVRDITDRKRDEQYYRMITEMVDSAPSSITLHDFEGKFIYANKKTFEVHGYSPEEYMKINLHDLDAPESEKLINTRMQMLRDKGEAIFNAFHIRKDGTIAPMEVYVKVIDWDNKPAMLSVATEISDRLSAEKEIHDMADRLKLAASAARLGIWDWDIKNDKLIWDDGMYKLYEMKRNKFGNIYEAWLDRIHPDDRDNVNKAVWKAVSDEGDYNIEFRVNMPGGIIKYIKADGEVFRDLNGNPERMIGINYDITERKDMESQLQQAQKMEAIGTLAGGIAHDFNNILSPIMLNAEMLMYDLPPEDPKQQNVKDIYSAGERAKGLVGQILTIAQKRSSKKVTLKVSPVIDEAIKFMRSTIPAIIEIRYDDKTIKDTILADPTQLSQIVMNLCTNAAHAMKEKGGLLEIVLQNKDIPAAAEKEPANLKAGNYLKLSVRDNGEGIPVEIMDRIFEPYYTTKQTGEGSGLGLAITHGIIKDMGGNVTVESEVGKGTVFHLYIPLIDEKPVVEEEQNKTTIPGGNEHILLVDDEKVIVDITRKILEKLGYKVTSQTGSKAALEAFHDNPESFDLLITDMTMPDITGEDLAKEILSIKFDFPIILCTGFSDKIDDNKAKEIGISAFVMKPIVINEIAKTIRDVLDRE